MKSYLERMKPSEACANYHFQNCHKCDNLHCMDNISGQMLHRVYRVNTSAGPCIEWSDDGVAQHLEEIEVGESLKIDVIEMTLEQFRSLKEFQS